jgi:hypothetical protein
MQGGKNWIFPKEMNANKPVLLGLSLAGNPVKRPLMSLPGTEWREHAMDSVDNMSSWNITDFTAHTS